MPILWLVIILGIVEGVTEYLPVSSTGHLILATELLGFDAEAWAVFNIAIQPGAILAVVLIYWRTFWDVLVGLFHRSPDAFAFVRNILAAFLPAVVIGLAIASGSMFALQVNSNFFWMFKALLGLSTQGTFKTLTMVTSIASVISLPMVMAVALFA